MLRFFLRYSGFLSCFAAVFRAPRQILLLGSLVMFSRLNGTLIGFVSLRRAA